MPYGLEEQVFQALEPLNTRLEPQRGGDLDYVSLFALSHQ
jgi:hypothetical protein